MNQGFSLTEVLLSLMLTASISLALLQQQWQVSHLFQKNHTSEQDGWYRTNDQEQWPDGISTLRGPHA